MSTAPPILVTGAHRSGTTWVGSIIATAPAVAYLHEPFHIHHDPAVCSARFDHWFTYICEENEGSYYLPIARMIDDAPRRAGVTGNKRLLVRPLIKDPLAIFAAPWLATRFHTRNIVMIRHPAAFVASFKTKPWAHPFSHFLRQPLLMAHHLEPFADTFMRFAREEQDIVDQAALLWTVIYTMVLKYQQTNPDWLYIRHEDLSRNPLDAFRDLFGRLVLDFSETTVEAIAAHSAAESLAPGVYAAAAARLPPDLRRDIPAPTDSWRHLLTAAELERVKARVSDVSRHFYTDREW